MLRTILSRDSYYFFSLLRAFFFFIVRCIHAQQTDVDTLKSGTCITQMIYVQLEIEDQ